MLTSEFTQNKHRLNINKNKDIFLTMSVFLFITMFCYAAISKWMMYDVYVIQLNKQPFDDSLTKYLAIIIPSVELLTSLLLITTRLIGLYVATSLMILFTGYIILILLNFFGTIPCSCGGVLSRFTWPQHLAFNIFFITIGLISIYIEKKKNN